LRTENVLELLVTSASNPRSLGFQLAALVEHLAQIPQDSSTEGSVPQRLAEAALAAVRATSGEDLAVRDAEGNLAALEHFLAGLVGNLHDLSDAVSARHFSHLTAARLSQSY
jgi:uncharacterized alpha-E superfamily protein